jgi:TolA-binding protein
VGATIDLSWMAVMLITFVRTMRLANLRRQLRIVLGGFIIESSTELSTELKAALRHMQDNDLQRAIYELKQVALDQDDSLRGLALYYLGECYLRQDDVTKARGAFAESVDADPSLKQAQDALARLSES